MAMYPKLFGAVVVAALFVFVPARADASCCGQDQHQHATAAAPGSCCEQPCCADKQAAEPSAIELLMAIGSQSTAAPAAPAKQTFEVWLQRPTLVGRTILQGRYVIEHDSDRMARGEPCTYLYAFNDRRTPVARFDCTHLERDRASQNVVVVASTADGSMQTLLEFQFAGENFAHGYPTAR
jgi:hypothetical protein